MIGKASDDTNKKLPAQGSFLLVFFKKYIKQQLVLQELQLHLIE